MRQPTILYNSEIWPKSVGCQIVDLCSQTRSLYLGTCGFGDIPSRFLFIRDMLVNAHGNIDRFRATAVINWHVKWGQFLYRCLLLVEGFIKVMNGLVMTLKESKMIFKRLAAHSQYSLPVEALNVIVELSKSLPVEVSNSTIELHLPVRSQYTLPVDVLNLIVKSKSIKSYFMEIIFFSVHSAAIF